MIQFFPQTRSRLAAALQNRNLLKSIGEFEEYQPVEARPIREIRSIFDCLGSHGYNLGQMSKREPAGLLQIFGIPANKVRSLICSLISIGHLKSLRFPPES